MSRTTTLASGLALAVSGGLLAAAPALVASPADAAPQQVCAIDSVSYQTPKKGRTVWIPTNRTAGPWQEGGSQGMTYSMGKMTAKTKGSSDTVGGSAGFDIKLVSVSGKYDRTWNRSTTTSVSWTESYNFTMPLPAGKTSRARLYHKGFKFPVTTIVTYTNGCPTKTVKSSAVLPTKKNTDAHFRWAVELYKNRGKLQ